MQKNEWSGRKNNGNHAIRTSDRKANEINICNLWDNIKHPNLHIIGITEGEEREKGIENVFEEIMAENFPNLKKQTDIQV